MCWSIDPLCEDVCGWICVCGSLWRCEQAAWSYGSNKAKTWPAPCDCTAPSQPLYFVFVILCVLVCEAKLARQGQHKGSVCAGHGTVLGGTHIHIQTHICQKQRLIVDTRPSQVHPLLSHIVSYFGFPSLSCIFLSRSFCMITTLHGLIFFSCFFHSLTYFSALPLPMTASICHHESASHPFFSLSFPKEVWEVLTVKSWKDPRCFYVCALTVCFFSLALCVKWISFSGTSQLYICFASPAHTNWDRG